MKGCVDLNKASKLLFCSVTILLCVFFSVAMLIPGSYGAAEGAEGFPKLISDGKINEEFGNEFEKWFGKNFAFRNKVVDIWSLIKSTVFMDGGEQIIIGKDGFLFFSETINSYTGIESLSDEEIASAADSIEAISKYSKEHGADFIFAPAPNKNTIYSDKMPDRYIKNSQMTDLDRLFAELDKRDVKYVDLRDTLLDLKEDKQVYFRHDTHWNIHGAVSAAKAIGAAMGFEIAEPSKVLSDQPHKGDLDTLLYPGSVKFEPTDELDYSDKFIFTSAYSTPMDMEITTRGNGSGKALIFRDSFANNLIEVFASSFSEVKFERAIPYQVDLLEKYNADYIILEIAERNIGQLIGCDSRIIDSTN